MINWAEDMKAFCFDTWQGAVQYIQRMAEVYFLIRSFSDGATR